MSDSNIYYVRGAFDNLRASDLKALDREIQMAKVSGAKIFAVGIYDDNLCEAMGMGTPLKKADDRMKIMEQIRGVDFTFKISSLDKKIIRKNLEERYYKYKEESQKKEEPKEKPYKYGYVPGTFDLFHAGHAEHLGIAASQCDILIVGVKADELVRSHKKSDPIIHDYERMEIIRHLKYVHDVYLYYTRDLQVAVDWIRSKYGNDELAVFYGSDLLNDFKNTKIEGVKIIYTPREEANMKDRSTSALKRRLLKLGENGEGKRYNSNIPLTQMSFLLIKENERGNSNLPEAPTGQSKDDGR